MKRKLGVLMCGSALIISVNGADIGKAVRYQDTKATKAKSEFGVVTISKKGTREIKGASTTSKTALQNSASTKGVGDLKGGSIASISNSGVKDLKGGSIASISNGNVNKLNGGQITAISNGNVKQLGPGGYLDKKNVKDLGPGGFLDKKNVKDLGPGGFLDKKNVKELGPRTCGGGL